MKVYLRQLGCKKAGRAADGTVQSVRSGPRTAHTEIDGSHDACVNSAKVERREENSWTFSRWGPDAKSLSGAVLSELPTDLPLF